jgi:DNA (cytosine-5)-methyltransferase 1
MRYGSVCSGIEAATAAWHHMGWQPAFFSEIEKFPRAVLEHHYPDVPLHGDFTTIQENQYGKIDLLVGGTPCQSFSIAGLRGGLDDERGNLALEFCRLAQRERPRWIVWENVPGVLSSNGGRDFGSILGALEDLGYGLAYRVLDAQYFGVAQRRRRVFVVGYFGDWRCAAAVLFERHSLLGHPAPSREKRQDAAGGLAPSASERGGRGGDRSAVGTLRTRRLGEGGDPNFVPDTANAITASMANSATGHNKDENIFVFDAYNQADTGAVSKTVAARNDQDTASCIATFNDGGSAHALGCGSAGGCATVAIAFSSKDYGADATEDCSPTLRAGGHNDSHANAGVPPAVAYPIISDADRADSAAKTPSPDAEGRVRLRDPGLGVGGEADPMYTLQATKPHAVAYSIMPMNSGKDYKARETDVAQPIMASGPVGGNQGGDFVTQPAVAYDLRGREGGSQLEGPHDTANIRAASGGSSKSYVMHSAVRRLTPVECERLQGFPDNFTAIPWGKKRAEDCPDGPRYKALGNSMAVPVMRWIGERIQLVDDLASVL